MQHKCNNAKTVTVQREHQWRVQANRTIFSSGWRKLTSLWALCGTSVRGAFLGELETSYTQSLKLSTVTAAGVNLSHPSGDQNGNDARFYTVFQLEGSAGIEQDNQRAMLKAGISR